MSRISPITAHAIQSKAHELLVSMKSKFGRVPNMHQTLAHAPNVLEGYIHFSGALSKGSTLAPKTREQISLAVGQANGCDYCLASHSTFARKVGMTWEDIGESRQGTSSDPKTRALLRFALKVTENRGKVTDSDVRDFLAAGYNDAAIVEVVANVALNIFTNYLNSVAETEIDFEPIEQMEAELVST